ncbi:hypothetical protein [uncultured Aliiroseovarius sp.]|uniref:hypothetical protein n=1 Tax=uncultured Aliiroseovarius sp. TaxID=1658783 RepID=UPI002629CB67|nr:hypothetical protein [uncultured Aliiroseovarius sp.]
MTRDTPTLAILTFILTIAFALSPALTPGFAGYSPDQFPVVQDFWPIQPAGWAFSIWGVIYIWLIAGAGWGLWKAPFDPDWRAMRMPLAVSLGIGVFWVAVANAAPVLATVMIFVMAVTAIIAMLRAGSANRVWQMRPVALYAGWLTAATGVGTGVVLGGYGLLSPQTAALTMLVAVLAVALWVQSLRQDEWGYPLAIIWALAGVIAANASKGNWLIIALATVGIVALGARVLQAQRR